MRATATLHVILQHQRCEGPVLVFLGLLGDLAGSAAVLLCFLCFIMGEVCCLLCHYHHSLGCLMGINGLHDFLFLLSNGLQSNGTLLADFMLLGDEFGDFLLFIANSRVQSVFNGLFAFHSSYFGLSQFLLEPG